MKVKRANTPGSVVMQLTDDDAAYLSKTTAATLVLKHILVPIDFSGCSKKSLQYAISFALQFGARITFLHVVPAHYPDGDEFGAISFGQLVDANLYDEAKKHLAEFAQQAVESKIATQIEVRRGSPSYEIVNFAQENSVDLIVLPTHGRTSRVHAILGSVPSNVARLAPCPVLVVPDQETPPCTSNPFKTNQPLAMPPTPQL